MLQIKINNTKEFEEEIANYLKDLQAKVRKDNNNAKKKDLKSKFQEAFEEDLSKRFQSSPSTQTGGAVHGGVTWRKLRDSSFLLRPDRKQGKIHIDSGALMKSLTQKGNSNQISKVLPDSSYIYGTKLEYAEDLQNKYDRPIVFMHIELLNKLAEEYLNWLINKNGKTRT